jgi:uncharacterized membrane protein
LIVALYLLFDHFVPVLRRFCDLGDAETISCSKVKESSYSSLFNVPIAVYGVLYFIVFVSASRRGYQVSKSQAGANPFVLPLFLWALAGMGFVAYLIYAEVMIGAICPFCTIIHVLNGIEFLLTFLLYRAQRRRLSFFVNLWAVRTWILVIFFLNLTPLILYNI